MKPFSKVIAAIALAGATVFAPVPAAQANGIITVGGPWTVLDEVATAPFLFHAPDGSTTWDVDCTSSHCKLFVTDLFVVSDLFRVFIDGTPFLTSVVGDWDTIGGACVNPSTAACHYTTDPDTAWADPLFSKGVFILANGAHTISIEDYHIPPTAVGGGPFIDGTVAFRVTVPEPGTLALLGVALAGLGFSRRKMS